LLILDTTRLAGHLATGMLANDFVDQLNADFARVTGKDEGKGNLWVIVASDAGQTAWSSRTHRHSVFGLAMAYALQGGADADRGGPGGKRDNYISAQELFDYVRDRVASWAPFNRDGVVQTPVLLSVGDDFRLVRSDVSVTSDSIAKNVSLKKGLKAKNAAQLAKSAAKDASKPAEEKKPADAPKEGKEKSAGPAPDAPKEDPAAEPAAEGKGPLVDAIKALDKALKPIDEAMKLPEDDPKSTPSDDDLIAVLAELWNIDLKAESLPEYRDRLDALLAFEQQLYAAERLLLAAENRDLAGRIVLSGNGLAAQARALAAEPPPAAELAMWCLPMSGELDKEDPRGAMVTALAELRAAPTAKALEAYQAAVAKMPEGYPIESRLLAVLLDHARRGEEWLSADSVVLALETRSLAEETARLRDPGLLPLLSGNLQKADDRRRDGEQNMVLRRFQTAGDHFRSAGRLYRDSAANAAELSQSLTFLDRLARQLVRYIQWLAHDPRDPAEMALDIDRLNAVFEGIAGLDLTATDAAEDVKRLVDEGESLVASARNYSDGAPETRMWLRVRASLELPCYSAEGRKNLLGFLCAKQDDPPLEANERRGGVALSRPAVRYPLVGLATYLKATAETVEALRTLGPGSGNTTLDVAAHAEGAETLRRSRADLGATMRDLWRQSGASVGSDENGLAGGPNATWQSGIRARILAPLEGGEGSVDAGLAGVREKDRRAWQDWLVRRWAADSQRLPGSPYLASVRRYLTDHADAGLDNPLQRGATTWLLDTPSVAIDYVAKEGQTPLKVSLRRVGKATPKTLIIDAYSDRTRLSLTSGSRTSNAEGRLTIDLPDAQSRESIEIPLTVKAVGEDRSPPHVMAWIERSDNAIDWVELPVFFGEPKLKAGEVTLGWNDVGDSAGEIELYPNESLPVTLSVIRPGPPGPADAPPLNFEVVLESGTSRPVRLPIKVPANATEPVPVTFAAPTSLVLEKTPEEGDAPGQEIVVTLKRGSETVDGPKRYRVVMVPVRERFQPTIDVAGGNLVIGFTRDARTDSSNDVPIELYYASDPKKRVASVTLKPDESSTSLSAELPTLGEGESSVRGWLSIAGVPRVYRYDIQSRSGNVIPVTKPELRISSPLDLKVYQSNGRDTLPVVLEADVDPGEQIRDYTLQVGLADDRNEGFDSNSRIETLPMRDGRRVSVSLNFTLSEKGEPTIALVTSMTDVTYPLPIAFRSDLTVRGELSWGGDQRLVRTSHVFLRSSAPDIKLLAPRSDTVVEIGKPIEVAVAPPNDGKLYAAVEGVEFAIDGSKDGRPNGRWDDGEEVIPNTDAANVNFADGKRPIKVSLPTDGLTKGFKSIFVRSRMKIEAEGDRKEEIVRTEPIFVRVSLIEPRAPLPEDKPTTGSVSGVVARGSSPAGGASVELVGVGKTTADAQGKFRFDKVPAGMYKIKGTKDFNGLATADEKDVEVKVGKESAVTLEVRIVTS
jgi:hypothetical protein